jgi:HNH endonuclease/AP2 domain
MKTITLSNTDKLAIVDDEDFDHLSRFTWHLDRYGYPVRKLPRNGGESKNRRMHRMIMDASMIDHANRDKLDNTRANLRACTSKQNAKNRTGYGNSGFKGVWHDKSGTRRKPFKASINDNRRHIHLGWFATAEEAADAYDRAALALPDADAFTVINRIAA